MKRTCDMYIHLCIYVYLCMQPASENKIWSAFFSKWSEMVFMSNRMANQSLTFLHTFWDAEHIYKGKENQKRNKLSSWLKKAFNLNVQKVKLKKKKKQNAIIILSITKQRNRSKTRYHIYDSAMLYHLQGIFTYIVHLDIHWNFMRVLY